MTSNWLTVLAMVVTTTAPAWADDHPIDQVLDTAHGERGVKPAPICADEVFLRRVYLDLIGRIPTLSERTRFLNQPDRAREVDRLLESDEFPQFWSALWTATLNGYGEMFETDREGLRLWLEQAFREHWPFDRIARRLIAAEGQSAFDGEVNFLLRHPEEPVVAVSRVFLGVRLDCARCHDHPYDRWTNDDFQMMQRFFELTDRGENGEGNLYLRNEPHEVDPHDRPRFLTGAQPQTSRWRDELALFTTRSKPFARNWANRMWYFLMGRGIVHPADDFQRENPPGVPELLGELTDYAVATRFDTPAMIRYICSSDAYQRASVPAHSAHPAPELFAQGKLKPMMPEQLVRSTETALGRMVTTAERQERIRQLVENDSDNPFQEIWSHRETVQTLMTRLAGPTEAPTDDVRDLYRRILSREPTAEEMRLCRDRSPAEVTFALLHSNEFFFNH